MYAVSFGQCFEGMFEPQNDGKFAELLQFAPDEALDKALADNKGEMPAMCAAIDQLLVRYGGIEYLDDRGVQKVLRDVSWEDVVLALKNSNEGIKDKIFLPNRLLQYAI